MDSYSRYCATTALRYLLSPVYSFIGAVPWESELGDYLIYEEGLEASLSDNLFNEHPEWILSHTASLFTADDGEFMEAVEDKIREDHPELAARAEAAELSLLDAFEEDIHPYVMRTFNNLARADEDMAYYYLFNVVFHDIVAVINEGQSYHSVEFDKTPDKFRALINDEGLALLSTPSQELSVNAVKLLVPFCGILMDLIPDPVEREMLEEVALMDALIEHADALKLSTLPLIEPQPSMMDEVCPFEMGVDVFTHTMAIQELLILLVDQSNFNHLLRFQRLYMMRNLELKSDALTVDTNLQRRIHEYAKEYWYPELQRAHADLIDRDNNLSKLVNDDGFPWLYRRAQGLPVRTMRLNRDSIKRMIEEESGAAEQAEVIEYSGPVIA